MGAPGFKDYLRDDIGTFLNHLEFADTHLVNGKEMTVQVDENELLERDKSKIMAAPMKGIYRSRRLIYVAKAEYGRRPAIETLLNLDGKMFTVRDCVEEAGILAITLEAVKS